MKPTKLFLILALLLSPVCVFAQNSIYKVIDFSKPSDSIAVDILYNYILDENKQYPVIYNDLKRYGKNWISAYSADLNDDGINEVIGIQHSSVYMGAEGGSLLILQKTNNGYKDLSYMLYTHGIVINILNEKRNGYKKMLITDKNRKNFSVRAEYINNRYEFIFKQGGK